MCLWNFSGTFFENAHRSTTQAPKNVCNKNFLFAKDVPYCIQSS